MFFAVVALTMLVLPGGFVLTDHSLNPQIPLMILVGKWFVFFGVGARLGAAGLRQFVEPVFTAHEIFRMQSDDALPLVRELGVANLALGFVGLASLAAPSFVLPVAVAACLFYGVAGARYMATPGRSRDETIAVVSDLSMFVVLAAVVLSQLGRAA